MPETYYKSIGLKISYLFILMLCLSVSALHTKAQRFNLKTYSLNEGLPQSQVYCIYQDTKGYLWFGTKGGGLARFDGKSFKIFTKSEGLADNQVYSIIEDNKKNLIIGTYNGVSIFDGKKFVALPEHLQILQGKQVNKIFLTNDKYIWFGTDKGAYKWDGVWLKPLSKLIDKNINAIIEDRKSNIWFGTTEHGVIRLAGSIDISYTKQNGIPGNNIQAMMEDSKGKLWLTVDNEIVVYDPSKEGKSSERFTSFSLGEKSGDYSFTSLLEDSNGNIWMGTSKSGILKYDGEKIASYTSAQGLVNDGILCIYEDREHNLWLGTDGGGAIQFGVAKFSSLSKKEGLPDNIVYSIMEDADNNMWFGSFKGLSRYDGESFKHFKTVYGLEKEKIQAITKDEHGMIWLGSNGKGIFKYDGSRFINYRRSNGLISDNVNAIFKDSYNILWIATDKGVAKYDPSAPPGTGGHSFVTYTEKDGLCADKILAIIEDSRKNLWFASSGGGVSMMPNNNTAGNTGSPVFINYTTKNGLGNNIVLSLAEDNEQNIWCATYGGISRIHDHKGEVTIKTITRSEGIMSNTVYVVVKDNEGDILIGTNSGVDKLKTEEFNLSGKVVIKHYGKEEGFDGIQCNPNAWAKDRDGNIWFGTVNGAFRYNPVQDRSGMFPPLTHITDIKLFFEEFDFRPYTTDTTYGANLPANLVLPYNKNHLTFDFIGITMTMPGKVLYRFKLTGFDKNWVPVTNATSATYSNLPAGKYTFEVRAKNAHEIWNKESVSFSFEIMSPWWNTWWFYLLLLSVISFSLYLVYIARMKVFESAKAELEAKVKERTQEMGKQNAALEEINKELKKLSVVARKTDNYVAICNKHNKIEWVNEAFTKITGYSIIEAMDKSVNEIIFNDPESAELMKSKMDIAINKKKPFSAEIHSFSKNGESIWLQLSVTPILDERGEIIRFVSLGSDITHSRRAREALKKSGKQYRTLFEQIGDCIFIYDKETHFFLDCNRMALKIYGYTKDEIKQMKPHNLHPPEEAATVIANINEASPEIPNIYNHITKNGKKMIVEIRSTEIEYNDRDAWLSIVHDITQLKENEKQFAE